MIVDQKLEPAIWCHCGNKIEKYSIGYGRTPYMIHCSNCKLDLYRVMPGGVGYHLSAEHAIEAFRDYCKAVSTLKSEVHREPSEAQVREYMYREAKGWGHNPHRSVL